MKKLLIFTAAIILGLTATFSAGCYNQNVYTYFYFGCPITVNLDSGGKSNAAMKKIMDGVEDIFKQTEFATDSKNEQSQVYAFNNLKAGDSIVLSGAVKDLVTTALTASEETDGAFDITVYPLTELWGFSPDKFGTVENSVPSEAEISATKALCGRENLQLDGDTLTKLNFDGVKIDLGGIVKGYAVDKAAAYLNENGLTKGYISAGTSSLRLLNYYNGKNWTLSINTPRDGDASKLLEIGAVNAAVSTSGDYERYFTFEGKNYCHIIDTASGKPIETGVMSATVIGGNADYTDALTTAMCVMGIEKAVEFTREKLSDYKVFITYEEAGKYYLWANCTDFKLIDNRFTITEKA